MAKRSSVLLSVAFLSAFACAQLPGPVPEGPGPDLKASYVGSALTCSPPKTIVVPMPLLERAKLRLRLSDLLRESIYDDAKGIVNIAREKEIKKLANKLKSDNGEY